MKSNIPSSHTRHLLLLLCLLSAGLSVSGWADIIRPVAVTASSQYNATDYAAARLIDPAANMPQSSPYLRLDQESAYAQHPAGTGTGGTFGEWINVAGQAGTNWVKFQLGPALGGGNYAQYDLTKIYIWQGYQNNATLTNRGVRDFGLWVSTNNGVNYYQVGGKQTLVQCPNEGVSSSGLNSIAQPFDLITNGVTHVMITVSNTYGDAYLTLAEVRFEATAGSSLTWSGGSGGNAWDLNKTANWNGGTANFVNGAAVTFDDSSANTNVNITGVLQPWIVAVSAVQDYIFTGSGTFSALGGPNSMPWSVNGPGRLILSPTANVTNNTPLTGYGPMAIQGGYTTTLAGDNSGFSGGFTVSGATLKLGSAAALGAVGTTTLINNGASLDLAGFSGATNNLITVSGSGANGTNAITATTALITPFWGLRYLTLAGDTVVSSPNRWDIGCGSAGGTLTGNGYKLTVTGSTNDLSLNYLGETDLGDIVISNRTTYIQGGTTLGRADSNVTVYAGSSLNFYNASASSSKNLSLIGGSLACGNGTYTYAGKVSLAANSSVAGGSQLTISGVVSGVGALTNASGKTVLTAANDYSGGTIISGGTLQLGDGTTLNGSVTGNIVDNGTLGFATASDQTFNGGISGSGALTKTGLAALTLGGANTYSNITTVSAGTLRYGAVTAVPNGAGRGNVSVAAGAVLDVAGFSPSINGLTGNGVVDNVTAGGTPILTVGDNNASSTFAGVLQNSTGTLGLNKIGAGVLTLTGNSTHTGLTTVSAGTLAITNTAALANSLVSFATATTNLVWVGPSGAQWACPGLTYGASGADTTYATFRFGLVVPSATVAPVQVNGNLSINGTLVASVVCPNTAGAIYPLIHYTGSGPASPTLVLAPGHLAGYLTNDTVNQNISVVITNSWQPLTWTAGTGAWDQGISGNWKDARGTNTTYADPDTVRFDDTPTGTGPFIVTDNVTVSPQGLTVSNATKNYVLAGTGGVAGTTGLTKQGAGQLLLATASTFSGATRAIAGSLALSNSLALQNSTLDMNAADAGTVSYTTNITAVTLAGLQGSRNLMLTNSRGTNITLTVGNNNTNAYTYSGLFLGSGGSLTKVGLGTFTMSPPGNMANGTLRTSAGTTLLSSGSITAAAFTHGGALAGNPTFVLNGGTLNLSGNQIVAGGDTAAGPGFFTINSGALNNPSAFIFISYGANGQGSVLTVNGGTVTGGTIRVGQNTTNCKLILNGGVCAVNTIDFANGGGAIYLNGSTLQARSAQGSFIQATANAGNFVSTNATTINDGGFAITIPAVLAHDSNLAGTDGGLIKTGAGTLTLSAANTYNGPTLVKQGKLVLPATAGWGGGALASTNATISLGVPLSSMTVPGFAVTNSTLEFDFGSMSNPGYSALADSGDYAAHGTVAITIKGTNLTSGTIDLVTYSGNQLGSATYSLNPLPVGLFGSIINDTASKKISVVMTAVGPSLTWKGTSASWDTNNAVNLTWVLSSDLVTPEYYSENSAGGPAVMFDDNVGGGITSVSLAQTVKPQTVTFNNDGYNYTLGGTGRISGNGSLTKTGMGTLTLNNTNDYLGGSVFGGGTVVLAGSAGALPTGGPLGFSGNALLDLGGFAPVVGTLSFAAPLTATAVVSNGMLTLNGKATIGGTGAGSFNTLDMRPVSTLAVNQPTNTLSIGGAYGATAASSGGEWFLPTNATLTVSQLLIGRNGTANAGGITNLGWVHLGQSATINADLVMLGTTRAAGTLDFAPDLMNPSLTIRNTNGVSRVTEWRVGENGAGSTTAGFGLVDLSAGSVDALVSNLAVGVMTANSASLASGTFVMSNGIVDASSLTLGRNYTAGGTGGPNGTFNQNGGTNKVQTLTLGENLGVSGTPNLTGTYNLNHGTLNAQTITAGSGSFNTTSTRRIDWADGTIRNYDGSTDLTLNGVAGNGGSLSIVLRTNGFPTFHADAGRTIGIGTNVVISQGANGPATLLKDGPGSLIVNCANNNLGSTVVSNGVLGGTGSFAGTVAILPGATLSPGTSIGTLTVNSNLLLEGNLLFELNKSLTQSNDYVIATGVLTNAGTGTLTLTNVGTIPLATGDSFKLFSQAIQNAGGLVLSPATPDAGLLWVNNLAVDGSVGVVSAVVPQPHIVSAALDGLGSLVIQGTNGAPGSSYTVLSSTNVVAPLSAWITNTTGIFSGSGTFSNAVPVNPAVPQDFLLLRVP